MPRHQRLNEDVVTFGQAGADATEYYAPFYLNNKPQHDVGSSTFLLTAKMPDWNTFLQVIKASPKNKRKSLGTRER